MEEIWEATINPLTISAVLRWMLWLAKEEACFDDASDGEGRDGF